MICVYCKTEHYRKSSFCSTICKNKAWYQNNKEHKKQYAIDNADKIRTKEKQYKTNNREKVLKGMREYYAKNSEKIKLEKQIYRKQNRVAINTYHQEYYQDVNHRIAKNLRGRLSCAIQRNFDGSRGGSFVRDLGCSIEEFRSFIEKKWTQGMNWNNYGWGDDKWHLDHIIPLIRFDLANPEEFKIAAHYTNYQPLWQPLNFKKGAK